MAKRYKTSKARRVAQKRYRKARKQYNDYLEQFEARKANFESRGLDFFDPTPLTFRDYRSVHADKVNDLKQDIKEGKRKTVGGYVWKYKPLGENDASISVNIEKTYKIEPPVRVL